MHTLPFCQFLKNHAEFPFCGPCQILCQTPPTPVIAPLQGFLGFFFARLPQFQRLTALPGENSDAGQSRCVGLFSGVELPQLFLGLARQPGSQTPVDGCQLHGFPLQLPQVIPGRFLPVGQNPLPDLLLATCMLFVQIYRLLLYQYSEGAVFFCEYFFENAFSFSVICAIITKNIPMEGICMPRTSNKAELIMDYVNQFIQENGYSPSVREIGAAVGLRSTASVSYHLQALQDKGLLASPGAKGRKRALVTGVRPGQIPVVGVVTAGMPILAVENQDGTMPWHEAGCFALRVRGDSMVGAGILDGDKVVVRPQQSADNGQIVVARIEDEATVKRLLRKNGQVWLMPENENYPPIDGTYAEIIGIVRGVVREY